MKAFVVGFQVTLGVICGLLLVAALIAGIYAVVLLDSHSRAVVARWASIIVVIGVGFWSLASGKLVQAVRSLILLSRDRRDR